MIDAQAANATNRVDPHPGRSDGPGRLPQKSGFSAGQPCIAQPSGVAQTYSR